MHEESFSSSLKTGRGARRNQNFRAWLIITSQTVKLTHVIDEEIKGGTSLVVQWLRLVIPMKGGLVRSLVRELDPMSRNQDAMESNR